MPELPEVETTLRGLKPFILHTTVKKMTIRHYGLRWPIPANLSQKLVNQKIISLKRRGKYLLFYTPNGTLILHLGMSGSLQLLSEFKPAAKHDHVDIVLDNQKIIRFRDPRRFGAILWTTEDPAKHPLLKNLGVEPLTQQFTGEYLFDLAKSRKVPIKAFIMNSQIVVGIGNIYAVESLFLAGIHPETAAGKISLKTFKKLANDIKITLKAAIKQGGTTLRDFKHGEGQLGHFKLKLKVYGRGGLPCLACKKPLKEKKQGQRSTVFCERCQV